MAEEKELFDEQEFADIMIELSKLYIEGEKARLMPLPRDWDDLRKKLKEYLERLKKFALETQASEFNIDADIGWPPRINMGLSFNLKSDS